MVTEEDMKEKLKKLNESKVLQEERTKNANEALTNARKRCSKENAKLEAINAEINRIDGYLFRKVTLKYGVKDHEELEDFLEKSHVKTVDLEDEAEEEIIDDDEGDNQ